MSNRMEDDSSPPHPRIIPGHHFGEWISIGSGERASSKTTTTSSFPHEAADGLAWFSEETHSVDTAQEQLCLRLAMVVQGGCITLGYILEGVTRREIIEIELRIDFDLDDRNLATIQGHAYADLAKAPALFHPLQTDAIHPGRILEDHELVLDEVEVRATFTLKKERT